MSNLNTQIAHSPTTPPASQSSSSISRACLPAPDPAKIYQNTFDDWQPPLTHFHYQCSDYIIFVFLPKQKDFALDSTANKYKTNICLFYQNATVVQSTDLVPRWLDFVRCTVYIRNENVNLIHIGKAIQWLTILKIEECTQNLPLFQNIYAVYSIDIKLGIADGTLRLSQLLRCYSTRSGNELTSLQEYVGRLSSGQTRIYYLVGESLEELKTSPFLDVLSTAGCEVLLFPEPIDEYAMCSLKTFDGRKLFDLTRTGAWLEREDFNAETLAALGHLAHCVHEFAGHRVDEVILSSTLQSVPAVVRCGEFGHSANMQLLRRACPTDDYECRDYMKARKVLELSVKHEKTWELYWIITRQGQASARAVHGLENFINHALSVSGYQPDAGFKTSIFNKMQL